MDEQTRWINEEMDECPLWLNCLFARFSGHLPRPQLNFVPRHASNPVLFPGVLTGANRCPKRMTYKHFLTSQDRKTEARDGLLEAKTPKAGWANDPAYSLLRWPLAPLRPRGPGPNYSRPTLLARPDISRHALSYSIGWYFQLGS